MTQHCCFGAITPDPLDFNALKRLADDDPVSLLDRCRKRQRSIRKGTRHLNWEVWVACYAGALSIRQHPERFEELLNHDFFEHRTYKAGLDDVLRLALLIGTDADASGPSYKTACHIASRLQSHFDQGTDPDVVMAAIEHAGGLKRLQYDEEASDEGEGADGREEHDEDDPEVAPAGEGPSLTSKPISLQHRPPHRPGTQHGKGRVRLVVPVVESDFDSDAADLLATEDEEEDEAILEVVVTKATLQEVLNSPLGSRSRLIIEHVGTSSEWERIEATPLKVNA